MDALHPAPLSLSLALALALPLAAQKHPDVRVDTGRTAGAATASSAVLAAGNGAVYTAWLDDRNGTAELFFNRSLDGGATWLASDQRIANAAAGTANAQSPRISASRSAPTVIVAWIDDRNGGTDAFCNRSLDGGLTWLPGDVRLDSSAALGSGAASDLHFAQSGSSIYAVWTDARGGGTDVYANVSHDSGATWLASDLKLNSSTGTASQANVAAADPFAHVVWTDTRNGFADVYYTRTSNSGTSWYATDVRINTTTAAGATPNVSGPHVALAQQHVCVVWTDGRNTATTGTTADVFGTVSHDSGTSWAATDTRLNGFGGAPLAGGVVSPQLSTTGTSMFVTWADGRNSTTNRDIFVNSSADGGVSWRGDVRLDVGDPAGASPSANPQIVSSGTTVQVAWEDQRFGTSHVFSNHSGDGGVSWLISDLPLDPGTLAGSLGAFAPQLSIANNSVYTVWTDDRAVPGGHDDVYFNLANGYQPYGSGTPGQFGGIPTLIGAGAMMLGGTASIAFSNGPGGALGLLAIGVGQGTQVSVPLVGGTLLVMPTLTLTITLSGPTGVPGVGANTTLLSVPVSTGLLGLNLNFQGLFLDAGAVQGVSMSGAIAAWIG
jgi:hypothetical protein